MIEAKVLADSISPRDHRLMTVQVTFPRYLLSEFNTHRLFSRNSASSRAIPPEKQLARILDDPFTPFEFYTRTKGMGQDQPLTGEKRDQAKREWLDARTDAVRRVLTLLTTPHMVQYAIETYGIEDGLQYVIDAIATAIQREDVSEDWLNLSKSTANRLLEPFMWHTVIVSSTEWENFFALRCPPGYEVDLGFPAEPEIQRTALAMRQVMRESTPVELQPGEWHVPLVEYGCVSSPEYDDDPYFWPKVSAGRCARVSFDTHEKTEAPAKSLARAEGLESSGHMSPFEHTATPFSEKEWKARDRVAETINMSHVRGGIDTGTRDRMMKMHGFDGNFWGWMQYRKLVPSEDNRRGFIEKREPWDHAGLPEHQPTMGGDF